MRGAANEDAIQWIERPDLWPSGRLAVLGEAGVGKSHFLQVFAQRHSARVLHATALRSFMPLPEAEALAVDDADCVEDPLALLHVLNVTAERGMPTLLAGRSAPAHWDMHLPDLASRLRAMNVVALHPPDDDLLRAMLSRLLADHQLVLTERLQALMLFHLPRRGGALREAVAALDRLALACGGNVTRAMVAEIIGESAASVETPVEGDHLLGGCPLA